jgi:glucose/arabinose dehydrogenase
VGEQFSDNAFGIIFLAFKRWGRPVGIITGADGSLYISDDRAGLVYRVTYGK